MNKKTELKTVKYRILQQKFKDWLQTLNYSKSTYYGAPLQLKEFLIYLENENITEIKNTKTENLTNFIEQFKNRKNQRRSGGLSISHINKQIDTINKFYKYLHQSNQVEKLLKINYLKDEKSNPRTILTIQEIQELYKACENNYYGQRDRAMLSVYYGCGLRKSEGIELDVSDVLFERKLLYIRKTKNNYQRFVPMNKSIIKDLETYIFQARPLFLKEESNEDALFISERGQRINPGSMINRLQILKSKTNNPELQNKLFGLHALRHSIATHLLQKGLEIEQIALFLGHRTLDSTQVYTHIINEII